MIHIGGRDFDPAEEVLLAEAGVELVSVRAIRERGSWEALSPGLQKLKERVGRIYLHLDLDVLDPQLTPANLFQAPGGLTGELVIEAILAIREFLPIAACNVASYDPAYDVEGFTLQACLEILQTLFLPPDQAE
jgi:arginase family enzyme